MNTNTDIIALKEDNDAAGLICYWGLSGAADQDAFQEALEEAGAGTKIKLPSVPTPNESLKRTLEYVGSAHHVLVRKHPKGGYALINESVTEDSEDLDYKTGLRVWWEGTRKEGHLCWSNPNNPLVSTIVERFRYFRTHITAREITMWLPLCARHECDAVSLRPNGGVYFVPKASRAKWEAICKVVQDMDLAKFYALPALATEGALEAIMDAVLNEAARLNAEMDSALQRETLGKRGLDSLGAQLAGFSEKLKRYEEILGCKLPDVTDKLGEMQCLIVEKISTVDMPALEGSAAA